jgi:hypothetical protein
MMTPSYALTATERVLPNLALDFTTAVLDARVTITRASNTATAINSSGVIAVVNANLPRFDYNPTTLACRGLLIEQASTNVLLNSLIDGTNLATQTVAMTAAARTLSFYGTGEIVLSGAHSATVTGSGAYPTRTTLTFTPTASNLTLTVTGTVQFAQLETGSFATSFIPTDGTSKTRNADNVQMTGANFTSWYNQSAGAAMTDVELISGTAGNQYGLRVTGGTNSISFGFRETATLVRPVVSSVAGNSLIQASLSLRSCGTYDFTGNRKIGGANGAIAGANTVGTIGTNTLAYIGSFNGGAGLLNGRMRKISYWPQTLTDAEVRAFSKQETP